MTEPKRAADAAAEAAAAAEQAREAQQEAQRHAERARRLAAEYEALAAAEHESSSDIDKAVDATAVDATPEEDETAAADETSPAEAVTPSRNVAQLVAAILLVAAIAFAVVALVLRLTASGGSNGAAAVRDDVLLSARQDIEVLNTLDYRHVSEGLQRWSAASTGTLHQSLSHVPAATRQHIVQARKITTATVLDAAVVSLDPRAGSATVIASVQLRVAPAAGGTASVRRERLRAEMNRVGNTWKVASLEQVGVTVG